MSVRGLVTGFEAFGGLPSNPAALLLPELARTGVEGVALAVAEVPVSLARLPGVLDRLLEAHRPDFVIALGLARGAPVIRVEAMAVNAVTFSVPDNDGVVVPDGTSIDPAGPGGRAATWDAPAVAAAIRAAGIPARVSFHAGTHMCNHALYTLLGRLEADADRVPCGFLHLPCLPEQVAWMMAQGHREDPPSMSLADQLAAVRAAVATTAAQAAARRVA
mgnify:CR=1 FL=1|jgi:pyroglutamyl-peptidase